MVKVEIAGPLNFGSLGEAVAADLGVSREYGRDIVRSVFDSIAKAVSKGHPVAITNFGTFRPFVRAEYTARNPQSGEKILIPKRDDIGFRVSPQLREIVRGERAATITKKPKGRAA
ncbi:HU family DNA-binding protein [Streptomyces sp. 5-10]|nr:HU family DNA-binding protein [Streptomyces sp. 5-10]